MLRSGMMSRRILSIDVGRKNLAMCVLAPGPDPRGSKDTIECWRVLDELPTGATAVAKALHGSGVLLPPWNDASTDVVVEQQPGRLNPSMVRMQHYIEMFFAAHGSDVYSFDAKNKLTFATTMDAWAGIEGAWSYAARKKAAVKTAAGFLAATKDANAGALETFGASKKKDDLADALLQAMAFAHGGFGAIEKFKRMSQHVLPRPRAPLPNAKVFTKSNVLHALRSTSSEDSVVALAETDARLSKAIVKYFGSPGGTVSDAARVFCSFTR